MKILLFYFLFINTAFSKTNNALGECQQYIDTNGVIQKLDLPNCKLAAGLAQMSDVEANHRSEIYKKMADKLAMQITQSVEETAMIGKAFSDNDSFLAPIESCKLGLVDKNANCGGHKSNTYQERLNFLNDNLISRIGSGANSKMSLQELLVEKANKSLGASDPKELAKCPIEGASGAFALSSQLTEEAAHNIFDILNDKRFDVNDRLSVFNSNPILKLVSDGNPKIAQHFADYLKAYDKKSSSSVKNYLENYFFKNAENKKAFSNTLEEKCKSVTQNITTFLCSEDLKGSELASLDQNASTKLFGLNPKLDDQEILDDAEFGGPNFYSAYGFQCLAKAEIASGNRINSENSVDSWFKQFTARTRPELPVDGDMLTDNNKFCSKFTCTDPSVKEAQSCKNGGPLHSSDLFKVYKCNPETCDENILQYISYMQSIEKNPSPKNIASNDPNSPKTDKEKLRYSSFLENYLGVQGTIKAEGREVTPITIAEKTKEMHERKVEVAQSPVKQFAAAANTGVTSSEAAAPIQSTISSSSFESPKEVSSAKSASSTPTPRKSVSAANNRYTASADTAEHDAEVKKMRSELEELTNNMKGSPSEKLATIADNNAAFVPSNLGGSNRSDITRSQSNAERLRNEEYQRRLNAWEAELRARESNLFNRETRTPMNAQNNSMDKDKANDPVAKSTASDSKAMLTSNSEKESDKEGGKNKKAQGNSLANAGSNDNTDTIISVDDLKNLNKEALADFGLNGKETFIMKVLHDKKYYNIAVKTFPYKGHSILVPLLNDSNSKLSSIVLESPLFSDYKSYQLDRQQERSLR